MNTLAHQTPLPEQSTALAALLAGRRRQPEPPLPLEPEAAAAALLSQLSTGNLMGTAEAFAILKAELANLQDGNAAAVRAVLARHAVVLEALFLNFAHQAAKSKPLHAAQLLRAAVATQQAHLRTLGALVELQVKDVDPDD